jgi:hypothetical protein
MARKPEAARLAYVFGIVLAVAAIILAITTPDLAAPSQFTDLPSSTFAFVLRSPTTGLRNETVDGSDCPTLRVE